MLNDLTLKKDIRTFSVSPENLAGEKGKGGMASLEEGSGGDAARELGVGWKVNPYIKLNPGQTAILADIKGQGAIKHFWITDSAKKGRDILLRIYFDGQKAPAVNVPLSDFFANADYKEYHQVNSLLVCFNPYRGMNSYFEMPYYKGFRVEIENIGIDISKVFYQIDCEEKKLPKDTLYFHAQFRRVHAVPYKQDYTILDNVKGNGVYVGTYMYWGSKSNGWWGEGEIKFFIDGDKEFPSVCGTGVEDYFCGSWCYEVDKKYVDFSGPYTGFYQSITNELYRSQRYFNLYRWHIADPIYFKNDLRVTIQSLGWRSEHRYHHLSDDISSVAYWYSDNLSDEYPPMPSKDELEIF